MSASAAAGRLSEDLASLDPETLAFILADWQLWARNDQLPPQTTAGGEDWRVWLILGGRGAGKTRAGAEWVRAKALAISPLGDERATRIALVGETLADVRRVMIEGVSGLLAIHREDERPDLQISKSQLVWPNGTVAQMFSAEDPDSLRGPQFDAAWCDAYVGACLERAGVTSTRSLLARSYLKWGTSALEPRIGAIAVFSRGSDPGKGHVGFWLGETEDAIVVLGGNQRNAVSVARYPKSRLLALRWPIEKPPAANGIAVFDRALEHVLAMEGGFTDDLHDPGGPTNFGITLGVFAAWRKVTLTEANRASLIRDLKSIDRATVREIYLKRYWDTAHCAELPEPLALMHFDAAVNHGVRAAIRFLQEAVSVAVDGEIGSDTRAAIAAASVSRTLERYAAIRRRRYRALHHFWRFGRGWLRRVDATLERAQAASAESTSQSIPQTEGDTDMAVTPNDPASGKWWGHSITIWGTLVTILSTVVPALAPVTGVDVSGDLVENAGKQVVDAVQTVGALIGTLMTIYGRVRATKPIALTLLKGRG